MLRAFAIAAILLATSRSLAAQTILGKVVLPDSAPVAGAIVVATNATGATIGRALTSQRGEFVLHLSAEGRAGLRVLRIGYRPTEGPSVDVAAGATERVRIVFTSGVVMLAGVGVRERETCRVSADTGTIVARVWEEARKAMLTTQLTVEGAPMFAEWIEYDRTLDSTSRIVREQHVRTSLNPTTHAFRSVPAELLRDQGFVVADTNGTVYYAPDAVVLLSDAFVSGHCFQLAPPAGDRHLVGVTFTPTRERRDLREIEGTLWVDRATSELRSLEFRYLNLPDAADAAPPGGAVEFTRLADGNWFVSRWSVRMPRLGTRDRTSEGGFRRTIMARSMTVLRAVQVAGGEVTRAVRGDSIVYRGTGPSIVVQLLAPDASMSAAGGTMALDGTDYVATADSTGRILLSPVLGGRYRATFRTPRMDMLGIPPLVREVETRDGLRADSLSLPAAREALSSACPRDSIGSGEGLLHGRVFDENGRAIAGAVVMASWQKGFSAISMRDGGHLSYTERTLEARSNESGQWRVCGAPLDGSVTLTAASDSGYARQVVRMDERLLVMVDLVVHRGRSLATERDGSQFAAPRTVVEMVVTDDRGAPLTEALLEVSSASADPRTLLTDATGRALLPNVEPGRLRVRVRRIGFTPGEVVTTIAEGRVILPVVLSPVRLPTLDTMRIVGARVERGRLADFESRRLNRQATVSITREEIEKRNPVDTWQMLTGLASISVTVRDSRVVATSRRAMVTELIDNSKPCFVLFMVDGLPVTKADDQGGVNMQDLPQPDEIHGIEVFAGPSSIPLQYGGTGNGKWCGLIAIWTR